VFGPPLDIWGLGVTLYCVIFAKLPFNGETEMQVYDNIRTLEPVFHTQVSPELVDLLTKLLMKDPEKRITIADIKLHPWYLGKKFTKEQSRSSSSSSLKTNTDLN